MAFDDEVYQVIRMNGSRGDMTSPYKLRYRNWSADSILDVLTFRYVDIAEEDDNQIFSVHDWPIIEKKIIDRIEELMRESPQEECDG